MQTIGYRIYGRFESDKRFRPYNGKGAFVGNLIHAMIYPTKDVAKHVRNNLSQDNPSFIWEVRPAKSN